MRSRSVVTAAAAVFIAAALIAAPLASSTPVHKRTTPAQVAVRTSLRTYLQNLQGALVVASKRPQTAAAVAPRLQGNLRALAVARKQLASLTGDQLDAVQAALGRHDASWKQQPAVLRRALSNLPTAHMRPAATRADSTHAKGFLTACELDADHGNAEILFASTWIAAQVVNGLNAANQAVPDGDDYTPALIATGIAWGVADAIYLALNDVLSANVDCLTADSNAMLIAAYPTDANGNYTPASSQKSVDELGGFVKGNSDAIDGIQTSVNGTTATLADVINDVGAAQGSADMIQRVATDLQSRTGDLTTSIGAPNDSSTSTANGLANTINDREDTTLAKTADLQTLSVRLEIEGALSDEQKPAIALFTLPASQGGYLETVRDVVTTTVVNESAAGQSIGNAQTDLAAGNDFLAAKQYANAYKQYAQAYREAVS